MKVLPILLFIMLLQGNLFAQKKTSIVVKAGNNIKDVVPITEIFEYPQFISGRVFFKDGQNSGAKMNYNRLVNEVQFIDSKGDTLAVANENTIQFVAIEKDTFYYDGGFLKLLDGSKAVKLAVKQILKVGDKQKMGGYDMATSTSAISSYKSFYDGRQFYNLSVREDIILLKVTQYYIGDKYNNFVSANKKNVMKLFSKHQNVLQKYLKDNLIDFEKKEDLEKLVQFLNQL